MAADKVAEEKPKLLDADVLIDEILAKKGPQKYRDGLSEDNWEQELEHIPLFATKSPDVVDAEKAPGLAALQDLKYELSSPSGRANAFKEEGNEQFRVKQYARAVEEYTAGLKEPLGEDPTLRAILYTNRAAAHFHLGNLASCVADVTQARKLKPDHLKALLRGAMACVKLERYGEALDWCDQGLQVAPENSKLRELRSKASKGKKCQERDARRVAVKAREKQKEEDELVDAIKSRGIQLATSVTLEEGEGSSTVQLMLEGSHPSGEKVHLDPAGRLVWPVLFLYPEHGQTDLISAFSEDHRFRDHLEMMFGLEECPAWDQAGHYTPDTIRVYFESSADGNSLIPLDTSQTLGEALTTPGLIVGAGTPSFFLLSSKSPFTQHFLQRT